MERMRKCSSMRLSRLSSGPDPKTERGPGGPSPAVVATTVFSATMAATQLQSYYKTGPRFLSTIRFLLLRPRAGYHARAQMQSGHLRQSGRFASWSSLRNRDQETIAPGLAFVNSLRSPVGPLLSLGKGLAGPGPTYYMVEGVSTPSFTSPSYR